MQLQHLIPGFVLIGSVNEGPPFGGPSTSQAYHIKMMENPYLNEEVEWGGSMGGQTKCPRQPRAHVSNRAMIMSGLRMPTLTLAGAPRSALSMVCGNRMGTSHWLPPLTTFNFIKLHLTMVTLQGISVRQQCLLTTTSLCYLLAGARLVIAGSRVRVTSHVHAMMLGA